MPKGIIGSFGRVFSVGLTMEMNYGGSFSKVGLNSFHSLNTALYG